jgi:hypothetical protein
MANFLASIFWPALLLGLVLAVAWRFVPPGRLRTNLQIIASLLVFVPQLFIIFLLYQSIALLLYQEALLSLWMLGVATLIAWRLWQRWSGRTGESSGLNRLSQWRATEDEVAFQSVVQRGFQERQQKRSPLVLIVIVLLFGGLRYLPRPHFYSRCVCSSDPRSRNGPEPEVQSRQPGAQALDRHH